MKQDGKWAGADQGSYVLPVCNVNEEKRNFVGYEGSTQYYTLEDIRKGDESGTTETDSATDTKGSGGYTNIYSKSGKVIKGSKGSMGKTTGQV